METSRRKRSSWGWIAWLLCNLGLAAVWFYPIWPVVAIWQSWQMGQAAPGNISRDNSEAIFYAWAVIAITTSLLAIVWTNTRFQRRLQTWGRARFCVLGAGIVYASIFIVYSVL